MVKKLLLVEVVLLSVISCRVDSSSPPLEISLLADDCPGDLFEMKKIKKINENKIVYCFSTGWVLGLEMISLLLLLSFFDQSTKK